MDARGCTVWSWSWPWMQPCMALQVATSPRSRCCTLLGMETQAVMCSALAARLPPQGQAQIHLVSIIFKDKQSLGKRLQLCTGADAKWQQPKRCSACLVRGARRRQARSVAIRASPFSNVCPHWCHHSGGACVRWCMAPLLHPCFDCPGHSGCKPHVLLTMRECLQSCTAANTYSYSYS